MSVHEIRPQQLRALLLLLVLVPFIPLVLMLRFMVDALDSARTVALERTAATYQQTLLNAHGSLEKFLTTRVQPPRPDDVYAFYRDLFSPEIGVFLSEDSGKPLLPATRPPGR